MEKQTPLGQDQLRTVAGEEKKDERPRLELETNEGLIVTAYVHVSDEKKDPKDGPDFMVY